MNRFPFFIFVFIFILSACGVDSNKTKSDYSTENSTENIEYTKDENSISEDEDNENSTPVSGGTLHISMRPPKTLNPLINEDITVDNALKTIFEPLFTMDINQKVIPNIAESYSFQPDGKVLTIKIKDDISWQDGTRITAQDVVFSLDAIKSTAGKSIYSDALINVSGYSANDNFVTITYSKPYSYCLYNLCFPVIPKHYYDKNLAIDSNVSFKPLGSGSYKFSSYQIVHSLILEKCNGINGMPYIDKIEAIISADRTTDLYLFEQGLTDVIYTDFTEWGKYSANRKTSYTKFNTNNFEFLGFNLNKEEFNNITIRQAIAYSIPYDEIINNIYLHHAVKASSPINPKSWLYSEETISYEYNMDKAKELINSIGDAGKISFSILVNSENNERCEIADIIANRLNQTGMNVNVIKQPFDDYQKLLQDNNFDVFIGGARLSKNTDLSSFLSSNAVSNGINYFNFSNEQMDNILNLSELAVEENAFKNSVGEIQKFVSSQLPFIGIAFKDSVIMTGLNIKGQKQPVINNIYNNIQKWYIKNS